MTPPPGSPFWSSMHLKNFAQQVQAFDEAEGVVVFYANAFGNEDSDGDIILPGAFADTIRERGPEGSNRIKYLWSHEAWQPPIGVVRALEEDATGLKVTGQLANTPRGKEAFALYQIGAITEHSIGLDILERDEEDQRVIKKARLWDVSAVNWGANPRTPTLSVKGVTHRERLEHYVAGLRKVLREGITEKNVDALALAASLVVEALGPAHAEIPTEDDLLNSLLAELSVRAPEEGPDESEILTHFLTHLGA